MSELPDEIHDAVTSLCEKGNALADAENYEAALVSFQRALALLPPPYDEPWDAGMWLLTSIGDMQFQLHRFSDARESFMEAMKEYDEARANPFVCLRLGQSMLELGQEAEAANWLAGAFLSEGTKLFDEDDPKYLAFIKSRLAAPPEGWPTGW